MIRRPARTTTRITASLTRRVSCTEPAWLEPDVGGFGKPKCRLSQPLPDPVASHFFGGNPVPECGCCGCSLRQKPRCFTSHIQPLLPSPGCRVRQGVRAGLSCSRRHPVRSEGLHGPGMGESEWAGAPCLRCHPLERSMPAYRAVPGALVNLGLAWPPGMGACRVRWRALPAL